MKLLVSAGAALLLFATAAPLSAQSFTKVAGFGPGVVGGAEISAFDPASARLFTTNAAANRLDRWDLSDPTDPQALSAIDLSPYGAGPNSVAVADGIVAVAVEAAPKTDPGVVAFFNAAGIFLGQVTVGALPDMVTFTPDGNILLVANEGEPSTDYSIDPEGSVSIIDLSAGVAAATVQTAGFTAFNGAAPDGVRIFGPGATVAQDLEPEYIITDGITAWVALQENNALAIVDIASATVVDLVALGFKDHSLPGNGIDASDRDDGINIANWPVLGMYQPDALALINVGGVPYVLSANEGDARDWDAFAEEARASSLALDSVVFPDAATLQRPENLGRLTITTATGNTDGDPEFEQIVSFGARSFSVWNGLSGALVWDSGDEFERITAEQGLPFFNDDDGRSDNKGPEPEGIDVGIVDGRRYAFIGLERVGGIFVYDVTTPSAPQFVELILTDDVDERAEGVLFVDADQTPTGTPWLVVTFENSGTVAVYELRGSAPQSVPTLGLNGLLLIGLLLAGLGIAAIGRQDRV